MKACAASLMKGVLALLACCAAGAHGASLQISPVTLNLRAAQSAAGISLQNLGDQPIYGQVRVFVWDQRDGEETLAPTQELVASPPIVEIAANSRQTIRLVRAQAGPVAQEKTYRVLIDEVSREDEAGRSGVDIRLRYSVPVFVLPAGAPGKEVLDWQVFREQGEWMLRVKNSGNFHAQIGAMTLTNQAGKEFVISKGLFGYVLAARMRVWRLPVAREAELDGPLSIAVNVNAKALIAKNSTP
ncbi:fimbrial biogenesis chaperone [Janthinobacterium lividum]|uniref:Fimbria/pilus periplasmic chaperone n=2 Tax=Janthinobacterium lividum TaxID=29581 RepID=A0ABU0XVB1_9BURK|nr:MULTISPECIES: fimbria/pilus periplasmic chaperone [Janthinobacterium]MDQ4627477.1 fimbria/pilus periplasmic chaperone [Janthinobacterium lividum]MDQ4675705.1 fimbria/pilus periplasmic chaperone [Janthinobacterium lividum]MDQ4686435.1 fimbria/pilus periplasmic chaperone [Janthinobacterium lividum]UGQ37009.1 fimbria/pilus periplasmic chaperone [Janthinobacterium sp. PLB04]WQE29571.1 fimbria/pilus periplasmic chaperone [Janthinobacterium lividum]